MDLHFIVTTDKIRIIQGADAPEREVLYEVSLLECEWASRLHEQGLRRIFQ